MDYTSAKKKNLVAALLLSLLLGPLGLFYSSTIGGFLLTFIPAGIILLLLRDSEHIIAGFLFFYYFAAWGIWPLSIAWAAISTLIYNKKVDKAQNEYDELVSMYPTQHEISISQNDVQMIEWLKENPNKTIQDYYKK